MVLSHISLRISLCTAQDACNYRIFEFVNLEVLSESYMILIELLGSQHLLHLESQ